MAPPPAPRPVALITGASRGIGRAIAIRLTQEGYDVALVARTRAKLDETAAQCRQPQGRAERFTADLLDLAGLPGLVDQVVAQFGRLDVLVNNAGILDHAPVGKADLQRWDRVLDTNVRVAYHLTHHALPHLMRAGKTAAVINLASMASKISHAEGAIYCGSKHALLGFSNCLFEDVRQHGIKVSAICPGYVDTQMIAGRGVDSQRAIAPADVAAAVAYVLGSGARVCPTEIVLRPQSVG